MIRISKISAVSISVLLALLFSTGAMAQTSTQQPSAREADGGERITSDPGTSTMQKDTANKRIKKVNAKAELKAKKAKAKSGDISTAPSTDTK